MVGPYIDDTIDALATGDGATLFGTVEKVMEAGHDPRRFASDLLDRFRDLILLRAIPDAGERGMVEAPGDVLDGDLDRFMAVLPADWFWADYAVFIRDIRTHARTLWGNDVQVGFSATRDGAASTWRSHRPLPSGLDGRSRSSGSRASSTRIRAPRSRPTRCCRTVAAHWSVATP